MANSTKILMVCLGNICRSPVAEGILRAKARQKGIAVITDSAGTSSFHTGEGPDPRSLANAQKNGIDISDLRARQFRKKDFEDFDLIYVMDTKNLEDVLGLASENQKSDHVSLLLEESYPGSNKSVPDPYFGGEEGFQKVFNLLNEACDRILEKITQNK